MANTILDKILSHSQETKTIIIIRKYNDGNTFYIGYIVDYNDTHIVLQRYSTAGVEDGLLVEKIENIESFETEDNYIKAYQLLIRNTPKIGKQSIKDLSLTVKDDWQHEILKSTFENGKLIAFDLNNDSVLNCGFVIDFDDSYVQLKIITNIGEENGVSFFKISDITSFVIDNVENRKREALYKLKNDLLL